MTSDPKQAITPSPAAPPKRALRVLQLVEATLKGVGRHVLDVTDGLMARGHEVHLVYCAARADRAFISGLKEMSTRRPVTTVAIPMDRGVSFRDVLLVRWLRQYLYQHGPFDIIHTHSSKAGLIGRLGALGTSTRALYSPHALFTMQPGLGAVTRSLARVVEVLLSRACEKVIATSQFEFEHALALGIRAHRLTKIPNGKNVVLPRDAAAARKALRSDFGIPDDAVVIGCVARLTAQKAIDHLLATFGHLYRDAGDRVRLLIVGDGELRGTLQAQCSALGLDRVVCWLGERPIEEALHAFDIYALPSDYEGFSYAGIDALAAGLAIVTTDVGGAKELVLSGVNGYIVRTRDVPSFATALRRLVEDRDLRRRMGLASSLRSGYFTLDRMLDRIVEVYRSSPGPDLGAEPFRPLQGRFEEKGIQQ